MSALAWCFGGPCDGVTWPVPVGEDGLPVLELLTPGWLIRRAILEGPSGDSKPGSVVDVERYHRRELLPLEYGDNVWRYEHEDYVPPAEPRRATCFGIAPEGIGLETKIEVIPGTPLTLDDETVGTIRSARPVERDGKLWLEYEAVVEPDSLEGVFGHYPALRDFVSLTYTSEED